MLGVLFEEGDVELISRVVQARRETVSTLVRRAVLRELARFSPLSEFDRAALEIPDQSGLIRKSGDDRSEK